MAADELNRLIDRIAACMERLDGGRNETTRGRRSAMLRFFHYSTLYPVGPAPVRGAEGHLLQLFRLLFAAFDRLQNDEDRADPTWGAVYKELDALGRVVAEAMDVLWKHRKASEFSAATAEATAALASVFDWDKPGHLRAYVYAATGEFINDGLLGNNRSKLIDALAECVREAE